MKLSIVITTRNRKNDLLECIESIKKSIEMPLTWELIIIDDCSTDGTEVLTAEEISMTNVLFVHNEKQQMMVKARNLGAKLAKGEYVLFIDDDNVIDESMINQLVIFADQHSEYAILGPSMYYFSTKEKYLDFQKINLYTGKTKGFVVHDSDKTVFSSDGIPNVFMIRKKVFEECGYFDELLIQTYTEPDYAFYVKQRGYQCGILRNAKTYHNISTKDDASRHLGGGLFCQKAYFLMRNRALIVARYGTWLQKTIYICFFSYGWPVLYSILVLRERRFDLIKLYWIGFKDGIRYFCTKKLQSIY